MARGGIEGERAGKIIDTELKIETRSVTLGHLQRGGPPSAYDRVLATRFGIKAAELVLEQKYGAMAALKGNDIDEPTCPRAPPSSPRTTSLLR